ncbi:ABC transporter ATP-binding protein [Dongia sp.]|uniref:ABC transporter ATP-binding protein n=1 Tax=Dongia sp. TaxID=1977262 RepID=UPI0035AFDDE5
MTETAHLELRDLRFSERGTILLDGYSVRVSAGMVQAVVSPDTRLCQLIANLVAGFERVHHGQIEIGGRDLSLRGPGRRGVMTIRPDLALFPDMSVFANIAFPLEQQRHGAAEIRRRVERLAAEAGIGSEHLEKKPGDMAPDMCIRVALARALAGEPQVLVLERPLHILTIAGRLGFLPEMRRLLRQSRITTLLVTDDLQEAMVLADSLSVVIGGRELQNDSAEAIFKRPANATVARLAGACNLLPVRAATLAGQTTIHGAMLQGGAALLPRDRTPIGIEDGPALLAVRPEAVRLFLGIRRFDVLADGIIADVMPHGSSAQIRVTLDQYPQGMLADVPLPAPMPLEIGRRATVGWNRGDMHLLAPENN